MQNFGTVAARAKYHPPILQLLSGVVGWYDASRLSLTNGQAVSNWPDLSVSAAHVTQATPANQPTFLTNQQNGLPGVSFVNADADVMLSAASVTARTMFVVANFSSTNPTYAGLVTIGTGGIGTWAKNGTTWYPFGHTNYLDGDASDNIGADTCHIYEIKLSADMAGIVTMARDRNIASREATVKMFEVAIIDRVITDLERLQILNYLANKWLITLPVNEANIDAVLSEAAIPDTVEANVDAILTEAAIPDTVEANVDAIIVEAAIT